jgi:hypothetical protein
LFKGGIIGVPFPIVRVPEKEGAHPGGFS